MERVFAPPMMLGAQTNQVVRIITPAPAASHMRGFAHDGIRRGAPAVAQFLEPHLVLWRHGDDAGNVSYPLPERGQIGAAGLRQRAPFHFEFPRARICAATASAPSALPS